MEKAARLADDYTLTHKVSLVNKANPRKPFYPSIGHKPSPSLQSANSNQNAPKPKSGENKGHNPLSQPICNYCKQSGNIISECPVLKKNGKSKRVLNLTGLTSLKLTPQCCVKDQKPVQAKLPETDSVMEIYEPFLWMVLCHYTVTLPSVLGVYVHLHIFPPIDEKNDSI